jgi:hypothetical protein
LLHDVERSSQSMKESSHDVEEPAADVSVFANGGFGFSAVVERSFHVVCVPEAGSSGSQRDVSESTPWSKLSFDGRPSSLAAMERSLDDVCEDRACRFQSESSVGWLLDVVSWLLDVVWRLLAVVLRLEPAREECFEVGSGWVDGVRGVWRAALESLEDGEEHGEVVSRSNEAVEKNAAHCKRGQHAWTEREARA